MSRNYIENHFFAIEKYANVIERRVDDGLTMEAVIEDNTRHFEMRRKYDCNYIMIDDFYKAEIELEKFV